MTAKCDNPDCVGGRVPCHWFDSTSGIPCIEHEDECPPNAIPAGDGYATACTLPCPTCGPDAEGDHGMMDTPTNNPELTGDETQQICPHTGKGCHVVIAGKVFAPRLEWCKRYCTVPAHPDAPGDEGGGGLYKYEDEIGRDEARAIDYSLLVFDTAVDHPREAYEASLITQARLRAKLAAERKRADRLETAAGIQGEIHDLTESRDHYRRLLGGAMASLAARDKRWEELRAWLEYRAKLPDHEETTASAENRLIIDQMDSMDILAEMDRGGDDG